ncbi:hypothetical protein [Streptomyces massasporeus]|uniref:hypothetical protein n=1 Tax=Streptomyces massasporeus TaxID=67324 RepID=UPI0016729DA5|nr:hypothetical protein [Streptomyces massasporeus]GGV91802.1 hypothetical protein GCM10010228_83020 [Streptomyces massasporeus]
MNSDADLKALCAHHGINTTTATDPQGHIYLAVDERAMRQLADISPDPTAAHAILDQLLAETEG